MLFWYSSQNFLLSKDMYSVTGFEMVLRRKVPHYLITWYLPSAMFVLVSWISLLIPPENVPGRMALLITVFLVLVNIFNTITTNIPKAEGLTAIETYIIACILFVFGALLGACFLLEAFASKLILILLFFQNMLVYCLK